jgi:4-hydroxybutyryl-CoA dehydratase/vinylacetyl-CoA-Delta-isomerase
MKTAQEYIQSLKDLRPRKVYVLGKRIDDIVDHPMIRPSINSCAMTYKLAEMPEHEDLLLTRSHLTGKTINSFCSIFRSREDLYNKVRRLRLCGLMTGSCFQRCAGGDAMNAMFNNTWETDARHGTSYHERFKKFMLMVQDEDLVVGAAMTDPKGNRSLSPSAQADPDTFLRVVEERPDGIVINGAKLHLTGILNSHWILVMPTQSLKPGMEKYAVCFAVPADHPNITYIYGRQASDTRKLERGAADAGNLKYGGQEVLTIFENIFIPWEHVFMNGEVDFAGVLVERFASTHRQSYGGCKSGNGDVLIGATGLIAEYNGAAGASHVKDKIVEMIHLNETLYSGGIAAAAEAHSTPSGSCEVHFLLANVCKQNVTRFPYEIARLAQDIAGGILVTLPSSEDFSSPEVGRFCEKYLRGDARYSADERRRALRLIESMTIGAVGVGYLTESMHGAGSPQAQRIMISRQAGLESKKKAARRLCGIDADDYL